jgi:antitoxin (DNA-binding transcriptional repressor) of toxin-antitoxin stability system
MKKSLNIHEAKAHLSEHLKLLKPGDKIILCRRNVPIAEILPIAQIKKGNASSKKLKRPFGLAKEDFEIPTSFFDPLPEDVLKDFEE